MDGLRLSTEKNLFFVIISNKISEKRIPSQQILDRNPIYPLEKRISGKFALIFDARAIFGLVREAWPAVDRAAGGAVLQPRHLR